MPPSRSGQRRPVKRAVACAIVLVCIQAATYWWRGERTAPLAGLAGMLDYASAQRMEFLVVPAETWDALSPSQKTALEQELERRAAVVYQSIDQVPAARKLYRDEPDQDGVKQRLAGFKDGMQIQWQLERRGPFWMRCTTTSWQSSTGAESRSDVFIWCLGWWVRVYNVYHVMA